MKLTIFTPTYNRSYILPKLYESLVAQTSSEFEWVIVDDGSNDDTEALVLQWVKTGAIDIRYYRQPNQGKHIAINTGVKYARGEMFFIVDSDDTLKPNAVEVINNFWNESEHDDTISGIISYREFFNGKLVGVSLPSEVKRCKLRETVVKYKSIGDKVVIYRTDILRNYPYPKFGEERFLGESYVFNQIDDKYDMLVLNERIYRFGYQTDGLSQDFRKLYRNNPIGMRASMIQSLKYSHNLKAKLKTLAHIGCLSIRLNKLKEYFVSASIPLSICAFPLAIALYIKIFTLKASDVKPFEESENL